MTTTLNRPVLVLNKNWQAIDVSTVAAALVLLFKEAAKIVDPTDYQTFTWADWSKIDPAEGDAFIKTTSLKLRIPEVIVLTEFDRLPQSAVTFSRRNIFKRDKWLCGYCHKQVREEDATIDHITPRSHGGISSWTNCTLSCVACNKRKRDRTPEEAGMKLHHNPVKPTWKPVYASRTIPLDSWRRFVSELYWTVPLQE